MSGIKPMPLPGSREAPHFKGKRVRDFIDSVNDCITRSGGDADNNVHYLVRYSSTQVRYSLENLEEFKAGLGNWDKAVKILKDMYGARDEPPRANLLMLQSLVQRTASSDFTSLKDAQKYYRRFVTIAAQLKMRKELTEDVEKRLFVQGIPASTRRRIRPQVDAKLQSLSSPPAVTQMIGYLNKIYNEDDFEAELPTEFDFDLPVAVPSATPIEPPDTSTSRSRQRAPSFSFVPTTDLSVDLLTDKLRDLTINQLQALLQAVNTTTPDNRSRASASSTPSTSGPSRRCFMCGKENAHPLHPAKCPDTISLAKAGIVKIDRERNDRVMLADGTNLPRAPTQYESLSKYLWDLASVGSITALVPKSVRFERDSPPHQPSAPVTTVSAASVFNEFGQPMFGDSGRPGLDHGVHATFMDNGYSRFTDEEMRAYAHPVTRSGRTTDPRDDSASYPSDRRRPGKGKGRATSDDIPTAAPKQPSGPTPSSTAEVPSHPPVHNNAPPQQPAPPEPTVQHTPLRPAPVPADSVPRPHEANLRPPARKHARPSPADQDVDMRDGTSDRRGPQYRFTSAIQERAVLEAIEEKLWSQPMTLTVGDIVGISPALQKRLTEATRVKREYSSANTNSTTLHAYSAEPLSSPEGDSAPDGFVEIAGVYVPDDPDELAAFSHLVLNANSVQLDSIPKCFAMGCGFVSVEINGTRINALIDCGSELNLMPDHILQKADLALAHEGSLWSLRGVSGHSSRLAGCAKDAEIVIGGFSFPHHFLMPEPPRPTQQGFDIILGQPFLFFYAAQVTFERTGYMKLDLWLHADHHYLPTVTLMIAKPTNGRNTDNIAKSALVHSARVASAFVEEIADADATTMCTSSFH
ncbi:hypothetical protein K488DRAFT_65748 [Vararia minispora EC-137]|uniref:Uncharacterized protein n=1 Tax=Vararia minispora EC-137 TaxID=1314806 RepID=A0ACB8Q4B1_9AGAM|nr:hypothetical protein K488DRAFT_65748 [Vararia minispora EC-137]